MSGEDFVEKGFLNPANEIDSITPYQSDDEITIEALCPLHIALQESRKSTKVDNYVSMIETLSSLSPRTDITLDSDGTKLRVKTQ